MKTRINLFCFLLFYISFIPVNAKVKLPDIIDNNMILQRNSEINLWGQTSPDNKIKIKVSWNNKRYSTTSDAKGNFLIKVPTTEAGGPYKITIDDGDRTILENILLGDVWLCSGQSNMEVPVKGYPGQPNRSCQKYIVKARPDVPIRLFTVKRQASTSVMDTCNGTWQQNTSSAVANFSAVAYYFGINLNEILNIPIGLINSSVGGSSIEAWSKLENIKGYVTMPTNYTDINYKIKSKTRFPTGLYNGMLYPLKNVKFKGMIWYQGEANRSRYSTYAEQFEKFITQMRELFNNDQFPIYFAQIAPYHYDTPMVGVYIREQQLKCSSKFKHVAMATLTDIGEEYCIHPRYKHEVSDRLSYLALADTYMKTGFDYRSPEFDSYEIKGNKIILSFKYVSNGIFLKNGNSNLFEIAGPEHKFYPAKIRLINYKRKIEVYSDKVPHPLAVRYAFHNWVKGDIFGNSGLPLSSFRTDDWE